MQSLWKCKVFKPVVVQMIQIYQQELWGKYLNVSCIIEPVVSTVNLICSYGLNHQFHEIYQKYKMNILTCLNTEIWILISSKVLLGYFVLGAMIKIFLNKKNLLKALLRNIKWLCKLYFSMDLKNFLMNSNQYSKAV